MSSYILTPSLFVMLTSARFAARNFTVCNWNSLTAMCSGAHWYRDWNKVYKTVVESNTIVNLIQKMFSGLVEVYKFLVVGLKWNAFSSDPVIVEM